MSFQAPIGSVEELATGKIWPGRWFDATPYMTTYSLGIHTGADLNLNYPHWDSDKHSAVYAMGDGTVSFAQLFSRRYWGNIIVIDHGTVDEQPLFSRYGHIENIRVAAGQEVKTGERIADVGNGEGLFAYHLHFDISRTDVLRTKPGHWPGFNRALVQANYVDPKEWLHSHLHSEGEPRYIIPDSQVLYVIASLGLRVRKDHTTSAIQVGSLLFGSRVAVENERVNHDSYIWGHINGGIYHGDWLAIGRSDQSETWVSSNPPGVQEIFGSCIEPLSNHHGDDIYRTDRLGHYVDPAKWLGSFRRGSCVVIDVAMSEVSKNFDYLRMTRDFYEIATPEKRVNLLDLLFAVANADGQFSHDEFNKIRTIADYLLLSSNRVISIFISLEDRL